MFPTKKTRRLFQPPATTATRCNPLSTQRTPPRESKPPNLQRMKCRLRRHEPRSKKPGRILSCLNPGWFSWDPYFMAYEIIPEYNWVGFHPLYTLNNQLYTLNGNYIPYIPYIPSCI